MPSLSALPAKASVQVLSNDDPILRAQLVYPLEQYLVFLRCPLATLVVDWRRLSFRRLRTAHLVKLKLLDWIEVFFDFLLCKVVPAFEAPDLCLVRHRLAKAMPGVIAVLSHQSAQFLILQYKTDAINNDILYILLNL